jgi:xanthine/CO dehydrogenase XdhC/CoxF family maturation factor
MKALQQIIWCVAENPSRQWALATLVETEGSTYRKPGARLLVDSVGATLGVLSGGCLEEEIGRYGQKVIADGSPVLLLFDTNAMAISSPKLGGDSATDRFAEYAPVLKAKPSALTCCPRTFF